MIDSQGINDFFKTSYHGHILHGGYSNALKTHVRSAIVRFLDLDLLGLPAIPYISAWHEGDSQMWYEYCGQRLPLLLGCHPAYAADELRERIIDRSTYKAPELTKNIAQEIIDRQEIPKVRSILRHEVKETGLLEAIYQIAPVAGQPLWLKDQANVESHAQDGICLSLGLLFVITKEMRFKEELRRAKEELHHHRDHLETMVETRTMELKKTQLEIVYRLARAAEFHDKWTGQHIGKISRYCAIIGKAIGLSDHKNTLLFQAAPMHDIGKIGISDQILLKPGKLSHNEFNVMKSHSKIGAKLLSGNDSDLLRVAKNIALTHHEKWDGSGYPRGLGGKQIPLAGRITAICDVFDALTSTRPYKKPWSFNKAVMELKLNAGAHFDPRLVKIFIQNIQQIRQVHQVHA